MTAELKILSGGRLFSDAHRGDASGSAAVHVPNGSVAHDNLANPGQNVLPVQAEHRSAAARHRPDAVANTWADNSAGKPVAPAHRQPEAGRKPPAAGGR